MRRLFLLIVCALATGCAVEPAEHGDGSPSVSVKKEDVREVFRAHLPEVRRCYEGFLATKPEVKEGKVVLRVFADARGKVTKAEAWRDRSTLVNEGLFRCISDHAFGWAFPTLRAGETLDVSFPYFFTDASVGDHET